MGLWAEKEKNEFFFCISPIAIANFSVGWQTLKYLYDILIPAERTAKKMSTCQKNPELQKIRCKLYIVIWFPETWRELRQAALYLGKKAQILSKTGKKKRWKWIFTRYGSLINWTLSLSKIADHEALETCMLDISCVGSELRIVF